MMAGQMEAEINGKKIFVNDGLDGLRVSLYAVNLVSSLASMSDLIYYSCEFDRHSRTYLFSK